MPKELPYFIFEPNEWAYGDISLMDYQTKGLFIDICCYYWVKLGAIDKQMLSKRFANVKQNLDLLFDENIIKNDDENNKIVITFLDAQIDKLCGISQKRSDAGKLGAVAKQAIVKQMPNKSKANDNIKEEKRREKNILPNFKNLDEQQFIIELSEYKEKYSKTLLNEFFRYWSEKDAKGKMKFQLNKTWDLSKRLATWYNSPYNKEKNTITLDFENMTRNEVIAYVSKNAIDFGYTEQREKHPALYERYKKVI